mmetsp:Transcript_15273/g.43839  ORF Transcript_15273/g.43839 Transcript_15273/m.43839 type:complete len:316 (-) Transcript_15273:648-1595(-)
MHLLRLELGVADARELAAVAVADEGGVDDVQLERLEELHQLLGRGGARQRPHVRGAVRLLLLLLCALLGRDLRLRGGSPASRDELLRRPLQVWLPLGSCSPQRLPVRPRRLKHAAVPLAVWVRRVGLQRLRPPAGAVVERREKVEDGPPPATHRFSHAGDRTVVHRFVRAVRVHRTEHHSCSRPLGRRHERLQAAEKGVCAGLRRSLARRDGEALVACRESDDHRLWLPPQESRGQGGGRDPCVAARDRLVDHFRLRPERLVQHLRPALPPSGAPAARDAAADYEDIAWLGPGAAEAREQRALPVARTGDTRRAH